MTNILITLGIPLLVCALMMCFQYLRHNKNKKKIGSINKQEELARAKNIVNEFTIAKKTLLNSLNIDSVDAYIYGDVRYQQVDSSSQEALLAGFSLIKFDTSASFDCILLKGKNMYIHDTEHDLFVSVPDLDDTKIVWKEIPLKKELSHTKYCIPYALKSYLLTIRFSEELTVELTLFNCLSYNYVRVGMGVSVIDNLLALLKDNSESHLSNYVAGNYFLKCLKETSESLSGIPTCFD